MAWDSCALLTSDMAVDVVLGVSFAGATDSTPITLARGSFSAALAIGGFAFIRGAGLSVQPAATNAAEMATAIAPRLTFITLMVFSNQANCGARCVLMRGPTTQGAGIAGIGVASRAGCCQA